jgi:hypothetical protein
VSDDGRAPVKLRDGSQVDGKRQNYLLTLLQPEIGGLDKDARGTQIDGLAELSLAARDGDIDNGTGSVPRMQATFH